MEEIRKKINDKDEKILKFFEERLQLVLKILQFKKEEGLLIENLKREEEVLNNVLKNSSSFYEFNILLFKNIINISKILQYEKLNYGFKKSLIKKNYYNRKIKVFAVNVENEFFNLKKFLKFDVHNLPNLNSAFFKLKKSKCESLLILKIKKDEFNVFKLALKYGVIVNEVINFKNYNYLIFSKNIYFKKGNNILTIKLKIKDLNNILLVLSYIEQNFKIKVLNLIKEENSLILSIRVYIEDELILLKILNLFSNFMSSLKILGFLKKHLK